QFTPDGKAVVVAAPRVGVRLRSFPAGEQTSVLDPDGKPGRVGDQRTTFGAFLGLYGDGRVVALGKRVENAVQFRHVPSGRLLREIRLPKEEQRDTDPVLSEDGRLMATAGVGVHLRETDTGGLVRTVAEK